mgnify:CR=1 FL=1
MKTLAELKALALTDMLAVTWLALVRASGYRITYRMDVDGTPELARLH